MTGTDISASDAHKPDLRPPPRPDDVSRFFWESAARGRLMMQRCADCGRFQHPPDVVCVFCQSETLEATELSGRGSLYTFGVVERAFHPGFVDHLPYVVALVELDEQPGLLIYTNIVDADPATLTLGMPLDVTFEERGDIALPQFRPSGAAR
jgi:uncharacterized OB-fold protein